MTLLRGKTLLLGLFSLLSLSSHAADGMINVKSQSSVSDTSAKLVTILNKKGMTVFNHIKHSEAAGKVGVELRPTELVLFGNPKVGSPLMQCQQSIAIDLPQKALVWEDASGDVWISYNDPMHLVARHQLKGCEQVITKVGKALAGITQAAAN